MSCSDMLQSVQRLSRHIIGPTQNPIPSRRTVTTTLFSFVLFGGLLITCAVYPTYGLSIIFLIISCVVIVGVAIQYGQDRLTKTARRRAYSRNLCNTVTTFFLAMIMFTILFQLQWFPQLKTVTLQFKQDTVPAARFPSVALLQRKDWTSQAILQSEMSKCAIGWLYEGGNRCSSVENEFRWPCRCDGAWTFKVVEEFVWQNVTYRYLHMQPPQSFVSSEEGLQMTLQAFFYFNTTQANRDSSLNLNPSLYLVVHDPSLSLTDALDMGYTRMTLFNANGMTNVDLTLQYREKLGGAGFYDYRLNPSTVTARDLVCDLGSSDPSTAYPCHTSLFLGFPTFQRSVISQTYAMNGIDVIAQAGAFMSLSQILSWVLSGLAFEGFE